METGNSPAAAVKQRLNIVEIVSRYVELRSAGAGRWMGPCPFHQETKPSFSVNGEEGFYYCFGCKAAGDVIDFYGRINGLDFKESLTQLALEAGVEVGPVRLDPKAKEAKEYRRIYFALHEWARRRFQENLQGPKGSICRKYLQKRGLSADVIERFGLGWSTPDWHDLERFLSSKGYELDHIVRSSLIIKNDKGNIYDRFRERLMFPITDITDRVIAFGGRVLTSDTPKYINSAESEFYTKGDHLYGLAQARRTVSQEKTILLTEGYLDVIGLHEFGFENAAGVLGTALTPAQVNRISNLCSQAILIFDGDNAGQAAALKASELILGSGMNCRVVTLPEGEDVDSFLRKEGSDALHELIGSAYDGLDFAMRHAASEFAPKELLEWAKGFIRNLRSSDLSSFYIPRLAGGLGLAESELRRAVMASVKISSGKTQDRKGVATDIAFDPVEKAEREVLSYLIRCPENIPYLADLELENYLVHDWSVKLWRILSTTNEDDIIHMLDEDTKEFYVHCRMKKQDFIESEEEQLQDICEWLEIRQAQETRRSLREQILTAESRGESDSCPQYLRAMDESIGRTDGEH